MGDRIDTLKKFTRNDFDYEVFTILDECPDLSYLGEYTSKIPSHGRYIDREERGDMGRHEYPYFVAGCGDPAYLEDDYKRMEAYHRGEWCMVAVVCTISKTTASNWAVPTVVGRASLWGIESDSDPEYFEEVANDMIAEAEMDLANLKEALCSKQK